MRQIIGCTTCTKEFDAPEDGSAVWLICPHCGGRVPNPLAIAKGPESTAPVSGLSCLGAFLIAVGTVLLVPGTCGMFILAELTRGQDNKTTIVFLGSLLAVAGGFLLLRVVNSKRLVSGKLAGQTLFLAVLIALAAVASFMFAVVACFTNIK